MMTDADSGRGSAESKAVMPIRSRPEFVAGRLELNG